MANCQEQVERAVLLRQKRLRLRSDYERICADRPVARSLVSSHLIRGENCRGPRLRGSDRNALNAPFGVATACRFCHRESAVSHESGVRDLHPLRARPDDPRASVAFDPRHQRS